MLSELDAASGNRRSLLLSLKGFEFGECDKTNSGIVPLDFTTASVLSKVHIWVFGSGLLALLVYLKVLR